MLWVYFLIASTLLGAASALWDKFLIVRYDRPLAIQAYTCYYQSLMMIVIVLLMWYPKRKQTTPLQWRWTIFLTGFLLTVSDFLYFYALSDPEALLSVLSPIRRSGVVFTFVVGAILFHERQIKVKASSSPSYWLAPCCSISDKPFPKIRKGGSTIRLFVILFSTVYLA